MLYSCCNEQRKSAVLASPTLNGIDYLEVLDSGAPLGVPRQQTLLVHCLKPLAPTLTFSPSPTGPASATVNAVIEGGESITNIAVDWLIQASAIDPSQPAAVTALLPVLDALPDKSHVLVVRTHVAGDFSTYCLRLVNSATQAQADPFEVTAVLTGFDSQLAAVAFAFKVECGPDFDCVPPPPDCPPALPAAPPINYLAKDYGSFRTVILDRLQQLLPGWNGASEADLGVALAELMAYVGDYLSYQQDAVATEAYLETARRRVSLRRHALLVDYHVHDGCNARALMQLTVSGNPGEAVSLDRTQTRFYTFAPGMPASLAVGAHTEEAALLAGVQVFEPMHDAVLYPEHNQFRFYTWGDTDCCLPKGAIEASLLGAYPRLQPGDMLIFQEVKGPHTGNPADADLRHRCAVRLTQVAMLSDPLFNDSSGNPIQVTEIQWSQDDALPFPVCISSTYRDASGTQQTVPDVSVAYGNGVLADHGLSLANTSLCTVPEPQLQYPPEPAADRCQPVAPTSLPVRYRPRVPDSSLTQAVPLVVTPGLSASALLHVDPTMAVPAITLAGTFEGTTTTWHPAQDLLESAASDPVFVVEVEANGVATLCFGDNINGKTPEPGTTFNASYRIGNGRAGNLGAESLTNLTKADDRITACRNPLPALGGTDPETNDQIRRRAPQAFLTQERAVTMADYAAMTERNPQVERAAASLRWTGSWYTVFIAAEPQGGGTLTPTLGTTLQRSLESYRLAGQDLVLDSPQYVSLEIGLRVCVDPNYFRLDVEQALLQVLSNKVLPNGQKGVFAPDNFTFGQTVYLSPVYAAARSVAGVVSVTATTFQPQGVDTNQYLDTGELHLGPLQVARLDNDPNYPDHGQLTLVLEGGK